MRMKTFANFEKSNGRYVICDFVCPTESPDGGNTGIINHLSIISSVSFNISEKGIIEAFIDMV